MSQVEQHNKDQSGATKIKWVVAILLLLLVATLIMNLPRGYSDDLTRIGKGKAAVVLVRDKSAVQSFDLMEVMNGIRDQYSDKTEFLLTDFNTPEGRAFMTANGAAKASVVLFDPNGNMVSVLYPPQTAASMRQAIDAALQSAPQKAPGRVPG
jgi:hypothetical protein